MEYLQSTTAKKQGWGSARWRRITGLTVEEQDAIKAGDIVWFRFTPWHHAQSGYKVVIYKGQYGFDTREPTPEELAQLKAEEA
jgi:hypothetical protein